MNKAVASRYPAEYPAIQPDLPGQSVAWLQQLRAGALVKFAEQGFPSIREEEWRYTNLAGIEKKSFTPIKKTAQVELDESFLAAHQLPDAWSAVMVDGHFCAEHSTLNDLPDSVVIMSMAEALETQADLLKDYLGQMVNDAEHNVVAFNTAWFTDGLLIKIPAKQLLAKPIQVLHVVTQADILATTRNVLIVETLAEVSFIETYVAAPKVASDSFAYLTAAVTEVSVAQGAHLTMYKLQAESQQAYHFGGTYVKQAREACFNQHNFAFGSLLARSDIHTDLGLASECNLNGLYSGIKRQHLDNHTRIIHAQAHAISRETYKGILDERARGVFQGRVIVAENAQKTDSQMNNRNLLLSNDAEADTKPQLEIYADDVKCAHGVTVGQLDEKSIFYLQSRGIEAEIARNMLIFAFANALVDKIQIKSFHDQVLGLLLQRFPQEGVDKEWL